MATKKSTPKKAAAKPPAPVKVLIKSKSKRGITARTISEAIFKKISKDATEMKKFSDHKDVTILAGKRAPK
jgi:hypothetical protein